MSKVDMHKLKVPKIVDCNKCKKQIKKVSIQTERLTENRVGYYFLCDQCGAKYTIAAISEKGQKLLGKIKRIKRDIGKFPELHKSLYFTLEKTIKDYQKEFKDSYTMEDVIDD